MIPTLGDRIRIWLCKVFGHQPASYYYGRKDTIIHCKRCRRLSILEKR